MPEIAEVTVAQPRCASCGRVIPPGYLPVVTKWKSVRWGSFKVNIPEVLYCRDCGSTAERLPQYKQYRRRGVMPSMERSEPVPTMSMKELAVKVFPFLSKTEGRTSSRLASLAELPDEEIPRIMQVMKKLKEAGKVKFVEGRWMKV